MYIGAVVVKTYKLSNEVISENDLILQIRSGRKELFSYVCAEYLPLINKCVSALDCSESDREDFLQVGLLALSGCVEFYDFSSSSFSTFVSVCVKRALISELRRLSAKKQIPTHSLVNIEECQLFDDSDPEKFFIDKENAKNLNDEIKSTLSELEYKVLTAYLTYNNYKTVAESLLISPKDVNNALQRARKKIKKSIGAIR